jgi:hypothetical protein
MYRLARTDEQAQFDQGVDEPVHDLADRGCDRAPGTYSVAIRKAQDRSLNDDDGSAVQPAGDMASATMRAICHGRAPIAEIRRSPTPTPRPTPKVNSIGRRGP